MDIYDVGVDVFRRWGAVSQLIPKGDFSILDIGGNPNDNKIKLFFGDRLTVINPQYEESKVETTGYADQSFDYVISIDTFEHVEKEKREFFLSEAIRLAKYKAIIACPFNEPFVADLEKLIYQITNNYNLEEHIKNGLPELHDVVKYLEDRGIHYKVQSNDYLLSWATSILLHQMVGNRPELSEFKRYLNKIYDSDEGGLTYRKIIDIYKNVDEKDIEDFNVKLNAVKPKKVVTSGRDRKVSIIIPTLKLDFLIECIESIENNTQEDYEIIVVNDGGSDPVFLEYLETFGHKYITAHKNLGYSKACNIGFKLAKYDYVCTLNADTLVHQGWLTHMLDTIESEELIAAVAPTNLFMGNNSKIANKGCYMDKDGTSIQIGLDEVYDKNTDTPCEVGHLGGACILFKKDILFYAALFDENYVNGWEDCDICITFKIMGYKCYHSNGVIEHFGGFIRSANENYLDQVRWNKGYFLDKWKYLDKYTSPTVVDSKYQSRYEGRNVEKYKILTDAVIFAGKNVLDIGCNTGFFTNKLAEFSGIVMGIDIDPVAIEEAKKNSELLGLTNVSFLCTDLENIDFVKTDITLFLSVYHHLINLKGLDKARDTLKKISDNTDMMIFETGQPDEVGEFEWKGKLPESFSTAEGLKEELYAYSRFSNFKVIGKLGIHGIERYIILCTK